MSALRNLSGVACGSRYLPEEKVDLLAIIVVAYGFKSTLKVKRAIKTRLAAGDYFVPEPVFLAKTKTPRSAEPPLPMALDHCLLIRPVHDSAIIHGSKIWKFRPNNLSQPSVVSNIWVLEFRWSFQIRLSL